jgi:hypothetical protein
MEFAALGKGYDAWCTGAESAITASRMIAKVRENLTTAMSYDNVAWVQRYCNCVACAVLFDAIIPRVRLKEYSAILKPV